MKKNAVLKPVCKNCGKEAELGDYIFIDGEKVCPNEIAIKLGKLEDLEDELGCPLDVVFKALKDKEIVVKHTYGLNEPVEKLKTHKISGLSIYFTDFVFWVYDDIVVDDEFDVNIKDYKKTWWLSSDLEE